MQLQKYISKNRIFINKNLFNIFNYSKSFLFGFRDGSLDKNPKTKSEVKKITTV